MCWGKDPALIDAQIRRRDAIRAGCAEAKLGDIKTDGALADAIRAGCAEAKLT